MKPQSNASTVSVEVASRDFINAEADRLHLNQKQVISRMIEAYTFLHQGKQPNPNNENEISGLSIDEKINRLLKRDDRIVAFIKEQEKVLLKPIYNGVQTSESLLNTLINILNEL